MVRRFYLGIFVCLMGCTTHLIPADAKQNVSCPQNTSNFDVWVEEFKSYAVAQGEPKNIVAAVFKDLKENPSVRKSAARQPEFVTPVWTYLDKILSQDRIIRGQQFLAQYRDILNGIEADYGVPPEIILAIWGIESDFGRFKGEINVFEALTNVGYATDRREFACRELLAALKIVDRGVIKPKEMLGSWAGAMGHTQFLPSKYLSTAKDRDRSGVPDIWHSLPDVFASTANHLKEDHWQKGMPWGIEVQLPVNFSYAEAELDRFFPLGHWKAAGVKTIKGKPLPSFEGDTSILLLAGKKGPAFLVTKNFKAILGYNYSTSYALAVSYLSEAIAGRILVQQSWPRQESPLSLMERIELQQLLKALDLFEGKEDGIIGLGTRKSIRKFQIQQSLPADGYADKELLARLRRARGS